MHLLKPQYIFHTLRVSCTKMLVVVGVEKIDSTQHQVTYFAWLLIVIYPRDST